MVVRARETLVAVFTTCTLLYGSLANAQSPAGVRFDYSYDATGQLTRVVDSTGVVIEYVYDAVGNMLEVRRTQIAPNQLTVIDFSPIAGPPGTLVTVRGIGFSDQLGQNTVSFNGVSAALATATSTTLVATVPLTATSGPLDVSVGGASATSASSFTVLQSPVITSVHPKSASTGTSTTLLVTGANLTGAAFSLEPALVPPAASLSSVSVAPGGLSASVNLFGTRPGTFALVASTTAGTSSAMLSDATRLTLVDPNGLTDTDGDSFPDQLELTLGSDPGDPLSTPSVAGPGEALSQVLSVLNSSPLNPVLQTVEALGSLFSALNAQPLNATLQTLETLGSMFSALNAQPLVPTLQTAETLGPMFSALNASAPNPNQPTVEALGAMFSLLNQPSPPPPSTLSSINPSLLAARTSSTLAPELLGMPTTMRVIEGQTLRISVDPGGVTGATRAALLVENVELASSTTAPYEFLVTVPAGISQLTLQGVVSQGSDATVTTPRYTLSSETDAGVTVRGTVVDASGLPVAQADVVLMLNGLRAEFFDFNRQLSALPSLAGLTPLKTGFVSAVNLRDPNYVFGSDPFGSGMSPDFAVALTGWISIATPGTYEFSLGAQEGARLSIGSTVVVDMPVGSGTFSESRGRADLRPGLVPIRIESYLAGDKGELQLSMRTPGGTLQVVPPSALIADSTGLWTKTDSNGEFTIAGVPAAAWSLQVISTRTTNGVVTSGASATATPDSSGSLDVGVIRFEGPQ